MITYTALDHDNTLLTTTHATPAEALDRAEADLRNDILPVVIVLASGTQFDLDAICDLIALRRTASAQPASAASPCPS